MITPLRGSVTPSPKGPAYKQGTVPFDFGDWKAAKELIHKQDTVPHAFGDLKAPKGPNQQHQAQPDVDARTTQAPKGRNQ